MASSELTEHIDELVTFFDMVEADLPTRTSRQRLLAQEYWYIVKVHAEKKMAELEEARRTKTPKRQKSNTKSSRSVKAKKKRLKGKK